MVMTIVVIWLLKVEYIRGGSTVQTMKASEFKAKCLHLMDQVNETGEEIVITKNGKPVSILRAYKEVPDTLFGLHKGKIKSNDDLIAPVDVKWDVE
jgi:prevent-host-death family protein